MPVLVIPLLINTLIGGALWMSEISIALKVILTIVIVFKFSITVYLRSNMRLHIFIPMK